MGSAMVSGWGKKGLVDLVDAQVLTPAHLNDIMCIISLGKNITYIILGIGYIAW